MSGSTSCIIFIALVAAILDLTGCNESKAVYPKREMPPGLMSDAAQRHLGQQLFMSKCASCHGKTSEGRSDRAVFFQPPAPDFTEIHYRDIDPA